VSRLALVVVVAFAVVATPRAVVAAPDQPARHGDRDAATAAGTTASAAAGAAAEPTIVDWPIRFDAAREKLTLAYRRLHQDPAIDSIDIEPRMVVIHYTGGHSAKATWRYFNHLTLEAERKKLRSGGAVNVSAHFLVDRDGTIYRLMPETRMARHTIGLNHIAIGVENVGDGERYPLTDAQLAADAALVRYLVRHHAITHLIGHFESRRMEKHAYWRELDRHYRNRKPDPGAAFMAKLRAELTDLALAGPPDDGPRRRDAARPAPASDARAQ
jgi:N-acetylmuramoyl-L-alanine amidase